VAKEVSIRGAGGLKKGSSRLCWVGGFWLWGWGVFGLGLGLGGLIG